MLHFVWLTFGLSIGWATSWLIHRAKAARAGTDPIPKHPPGMEEKNPYSLRPCILTPGERSFYSALIRILPENYSVFLKVRLGDLVNVTYGAKNRQDAHARACSKSLDFVICDSALTPIVAIDLVEGTADRSTQRNREFVGTVLEKASLALERIPLQPSYRESELRALFASHLSLPPAAGNVIAMTA